MFYVTPNHLSCFDLDQVLKFNYFVDEEGKLDNTSLIIDFKTGHSIKLLCQNEYNAQQVFEDLLMYLKPIQTIDKKVYKRNNKKEEK